MLRKSDLRFQWTLGLLLVLFSLTMIAPLVHLLAVSLSARDYAEAKLVTFWPRGFHLGVYDTIVHMPKIWRALGVSVYITVAGTVAALALNSMLAYALARPMPGKRWVMRGLVATLIFTAPLIPNYLVIRSYGLENTLWSLILPGAVGAFYIIIMKTFFQGISGELYDAAKIDGSGEASIYARIVIPLSRPVMATIVLFHAVGQWNAYFNALLYIRKPEWKPLQLLLRDLVVDSSANWMVNSNVDMQLISTPEMMRAGILLFATAPIVVVYPFLQKYFVKGAMVGSLKE